MRLSGQRIIARVRNQAYLSTLSQEPEFADRGAGDIVSRLGIDTGIVGDSVTSNLSDGLRCVFIFHLFCFLALKSRMSRNSLQMLMLGFELTLCCH